MSGGLRIRLPDRLCKALFPRRFAQRQRDQEEKLRQARWDKLADEEYEVWVNGGKEAWRAWRMEQTAKRLEAIENDPDPGLLGKDVKRYIVLHQERQYPPLSPEQRRELNKRSVGRG